MVGLSEKSFCNICGPEHSSQLRLRRVHGFEHDRWNIDRSVHARYVELDNMALPAFVGASQDTPDGSDSDSTHSSSTISNSVSINVSSSVSSDYHGDVDYDDVLDEAVRAFAMHCTGLTEVRITTDCYANAMTPLGLLCIAERGGSQLRRLAVEVYDASCSAQTMDGAIDELARRCQHIESLILRCAKASSAALARLVTAQHHLREVGVEAMYVDDTILLAIAQHGAHLTGLDLQVRDRYTAEGLTALAQACKALRTVYLSSLHPPVTEDFLAYWREVNPRVRFMIGTEGCPFWDSK